MSKTRCDQITIVTLYDDRLGETYVGAIANKLTNKEQRAWAKLNNAVLDGDPGSDDEDGRRMWFVRVTLDGGTLLNAFKVE